MFSFVQNRGYNGNEEVSKCLAETANRLKEIKDKAEKRRKQVKKHKDNEPT